MPKNLPFTVFHRSGGAVEYNFPLHPETQSATDVHNVLAHLRDALTFLLDNKKMGNGDVLQAITMLLCMRADMVDIDRDTMRSLIEKMIAENMAATHAAVRGQVSRA
ncbi:MAG: hypothetical protein COC05_05750 [Gammaproteobacteria bacterium]|nr:MAG: hypothetical protein COC05_05750 [Gammaproteobacteria bacterium]